MRRILKTKFFSRWALRSGLSDTELLKSVQEIAHGLVDGDLGGGVVKKRVALEGRGKRANISPRELEALRELASDLLELNERQIDAQINRGALEEIDS